MTSTLKLTPILLILLLTLASSSTPQTPQDARTPTQSWMAQENDKNTSHEKFWTGHVAWWRTVTKMKVTIRELFKKSYPTMCKRLQAVKPSLEKMREQYKAAPGRMRDGRVNMAKKSKATDKA
jgi:hypothetical protein